MSSKIKIFITCGAICLVSLVFIKFILWGKEAFAPYIGV